MLLKRSLGFIDIVLMNLVIVINLRWVALAASSGPSSITLWILAAVLFFLPQGLAVAELSSRFPEGGGLYRWTQRAFGEHHAFLCGWCYWVNNLLYFPGMMIFVSGNVALALQPFFPKHSLEHNTLFIVSLALLVLWGIALLSFVGMKTGKIVQNVGAVASWIPVLLVVVLGVVFFRLFGSATHLDLKVLVPKLAGLERISFFSQMCFAFAGLEALSFVIAEIRNPARTITRALVASALVVVLVYSISTLGVMIMMAPERINAVNGLLFPMQEAGKLLGLSWLSPVCAAAIAVCGTATTLAWFAVASRVPYVVGVDRYLPPSFGRLHPKYATPYVAIFVQVAISTLFTLIVTMGANTKLEVIYKILVDMSLVIYFVPYCYLFSSLFLLRKGRLQGEGYRIPGGTFGVSCVSLIGLISTLVAITLTIVPTESAGFQIASKTLGGGLLILGVGLLIYWRGRSRQPAIAAAEPA